MKHHLIFTTSSLLGLAAAAAFTLSACQTGRHTPASTASSAAPNAGGETGKSGNQLWSENCTRCHSERSPATYSDQQWAVAMHHMRIRANLTAEEHTKILEFLQSAN